MIPLEKAKQDPDVWELLDGHHIERPLEVSENPLEDLRLEDFSSNDLEVVKQFLEKVKAENAKDDDSIR